MSKRKESVLDKKPIYEYVQVGVKLRKEVAARVARYCKWGNHEKAAVIDGLLEEMMNRHKEFMRWEAAQASAGALDIVSAPKRKKKAAEAAA